MLHENGTYGAHFFTSLRARDAMVVWRCTLAKAIEQLGFSCMFHAKIQLVVQLEIKHVHVRCLVIHTRKTGECVLLEYRVLPLTF